MFAALEGSAVQRGRLGRNSKSLVWDRTREQREHVEFDTMSRISRLNDGQGELRILQANSDTTKQSENAQFITVGN
jgi:hypothetical protein